MKKVIVTGTFDILHPGHLNFFSQAKKYGELVIVVARDDTVLKVKGKLPRFSQLQRKNHLIEARVAKKVIIGSANDKCRVLEKEKPDYICLGYDQEAFTENLEPELKRRSLSAKIIRLKPFKPEIYKSSKISGYSSKNFQ